MSTAVSRARPTAAHAGAILLFLSAAALAAAWIGLNFAFPDLTPTGIPTAVTRIIIHTAVLAGLWLGLSRADFGGERRLVTWLAIAVPYTAWLAVVWALAVEGAFRPGTLRVPALPIAIFVPVLVGFVLLPRSKRLAAVLDATPPSWLVGFQVYRILGGIFLVGWARNTLPAAFALPAGTGDVLVGLLALPVAAYLQAGAPGGRNTAIAWNVLGLLDFAVAISMGMLSSPGPLQVFALDHPNVQLGTYPTVMIPAFAVPSSILLHGLSLWQLKRSARTGGAARALTQARPGSEITR